ncbi:phage tail protein [Kitasatospora sp. NPDC093806]|uniref:phage tail protein n=1 Tax=Kitasatospora sp. NPDC093806 TaxID=3155075 RepID=UPI003441C66F
MSADEYRYRLSVQGTDFLFREIAGLDVEFEVVRYRNGTDRTTRSVPGPPKPPSVSLRGGDPAGYQALATWAGLVTAGTPAQREAVVTLVDESGPAPAAAVSWVIVDSFPSRLTSLVYDEAVGGPVIGELVLAGYAVVPRFGP